MLTFSHIYRNQWIPKLGSITTFWKKECKRKTLTDYDIFIIKHHILLEFFLWIECQVSDPFLDLDSCIIPWIMYPNITLIFGYCLDLQYTQFCSHSCWSVTTSFFKTPEHLWAYSVFNNSFPKPMSDSRSTQYDDSITEEFQAIAEKSFLKTCDLCSVSSSHRLLPLRVALHRWCLESIDICWVSAS